MSCTLHSLLTESSVNEQFCLYMQKHQILFLKLSLNFSRDYYAIISLFLCSIVLYSTADIYAKTNQSGLRHC